MATLTSHRFSVSQVRLGNVYRKPLSDSLFCSEAYEECDPPKRVKTFPRPHSMFSHLNPRMKNDQTLFECMDSASVKDYHSRNDRYRAFVVYDFTIPDLNLPIEPLGPAIPSLNWTVGFYEYLVHLISFSWPHRRACPIQSKCRNDRNDRLLPNCRNQR